MRVEELDYELPEELIAQVPLPERDASRLMLVDVPLGSIEDCAFLALSDHLPPSLWVFNDTRVWGARFRGYKDTGGRVELLLLRCLGGSASSERWLAMGRASKPFRVGSALSLADSRLCGTVVRVLGDGELEVDLSAETSVQQLIRDAGEFPLPPYIRRSPNTLDVNRYQTIYAAKLGAVAAPTAGLHFTERIMRKLAEANHQMVYVTLHVGPGTFRPVQGEDLADHRMDEEHYQVTSEVAEAIVQARVEGRPIVAVGTTVVRTLESSVDGAGRVQAGSGATRLFIRPPFRFRVVNSLLTNFHLPRSTLMALVMAFGGTDLIRRAYEEAIERRYRFYSYGDAMLIRQGVR